MRRAGGRASRRLVVVAMLVFATLSVDSTFASSGEITAVQASGDWTQARIAGRVVWTEACEPWPDLPSEPTATPEWTCSEWIPYATLAPESLEADCSSPDRNLPGIGDRIQIVWTGDEGSGVGSAGFDLPEVPLQSGAGPLLLCLSATETLTEYRCGWIGGWDCHGEMSYRVHQFESAVLVPALPVDDPPRDAPPPVIGPPLQQSFTGPSASVGEPGAYKRRKTGCRGVKRGQGLRLKRGATVGHVQRKREKRCKRDRRSKRGLAN